MNNEKIKCPACDSENVELDPDDEAGLEIQCLDCGEVWI